MLLIRRVTCQSRNVFRKQGKEANEQIRKECSLGEKRSVNKDSLGKKNHRKRMLGCWGEMPAQEKGTDKHLGSGIVQNYMT
jgi:hypothetical protein